MSLRSFLMLLSIALIAACGTAGPSWAETGAQKWPDQAQLRRQLEQCHLAKPPEGVPAGEARAAALDYESQCHRQLAEIAHAKLDALQDAASGNRARKMADRAPLPPCRLSKPPEAVPENEVRVATLDYENQCYRQLAERELGKLDALGAAPRIAQPPYLLHRIRHWRMARRQPFTTSFQATR